MNKRHKASSPRDIDGDTPDPASGSESARAQTVKKSKGTSSSESSKRKANKATRFAAIAAAVQSAAHGKRRSGADAFLGAVAPGNATAAASASAAEPGDAVEPATVAAAANATPAAASAAPAPVLTTFSLPAECTVASAVALKEQLARLLDEPRPVTLDISTLQRIDTAALQVITAFVRERTGNGHAVEWRGTAPVLVTAAQLLGLTSLLKLPA